MMRLLIVCLLLIVLGIVPLSAQTSPTDNLTRLQSLDFDAFLDESYYVLLARNPELVIELSLQDELGLEGVMLNDVSDAYQQASATLIAEVLAQLRARDRSALSAEQQLSYDVYDWYLDDLLQGHDFRLYEFPVTYFLIADHNQTANFFTEIHPLVTLQDARDYITRLQLVDEKFAQIADNVMLRADAGIVPPQGIIQWTMGDLNRLSGGSVQNHDYFIAFVEGVTSIADIDGATRLSLFEDAETAIREHVMPAYQLLADTMTNIFADAPQAFGAWQYADGDVFYQYALRHHTTTELTADDIHNLGLQELARIHIEMRLLFDELDYDSTQSIPILYDQLIRNGQFISASQVVPTFEALIDDAYPRLEEAFSHIPEAEVVVIGGETGGYYIPAALDGSRAGAFYASATRNQPYFNMPSLLYHETIPGHHLQIAWAQEQDLPAFRRAPLFTAYVEGWALYAERLAYDLGWYDDDPVANLGRLQYEAFRAARLVVDTGLHARQWTVGDSVTFFANNTGFSTGMAQGQMARYTVWAGQSTSYMVGMLEILRLRDTMQSTLGDDFDLIQFHDLMLDNGSVPLAILEQIIMDALAE